MKGRKETKTEKIFRLDKFIGLAGCEFTCELDTAKNKKRTQKGEQMNEKEKCNTLPIVLHFSLHLIYRN